MPFALRRTSEIRAVLKACTWVKKHGITMHLGGNGSVGKWQRKAPVS